MRRLKAVLLVYVLCNVTSCFIFDECFAVTDCGIPDEKLPVYANKSGEIIKIITITEDYPQGEEFIANGDTLYNYSIKEQNVSFPIGCRIGCSFAYCRDNPIRVELHFLDDSQRCLIFDGPIKNDGIDMRSWDSYKKGHEIDGWDDFIAGMEYVYTITSEHRDMAKEEDCQNLGEQQRGHAL